jgi:hypothetical protein
MGCNCGKARARVPAPPPANVKKPAPNVERQGDVSSSDASRSVGSAQVREVERLTGVRETFSLMTPDRRVQTFGSRLEAEAARVRAGGVGTIS